MLLHNSIQNFSPEAVVEIKTTEFSNQILDYTWLNWLEGFLIPHRKLFSPPLLYFSLKGKPSRSGKIQLRLAHASFCIWLHLKNYV